MAELSALGMRRLRRTVSLRNLFTATRLHIHDLILPVFVQEGITSPTEIAHMQGVLRYPEEHLGDYLKEVADLGIQSVMLFGVPQQKDAIGADTLNMEGLMARMVKIAKNAVPDVTIITDNCFCDYTDHGHCGVVVDGDMDNNQTLANLGRQVLIAARAGVDMVAPSGMVDGQVACIREHLDRSGFNHVAIMSYSSKFSSSFYGPFRDAVQSKFQDTRDSYQLNPANARESLTESLIDIEEGADVLMVKPGLPYLDVLANISQRSSIPVAVYQVSGEYAMLRLAADTGIGDERALVLEALTAFKRAGADVIVTYYATEVAKWLNS